jgi:hypothetical protein
VECPVTKSIFYYIQEKKMHFKSLGNNFVSSQYCSSGGHVNLVRLGFVLRKKKRSNLKTPSKTVHELLEDVVV